MHILCIETAECTFGTSRPLHAERIIWGPFQDPVWPLQKSALKPIGIELSCMVNEQEFLICYHI